MAIGRNWPVAPVQLRPLKPRFAKTGTGSPTAKMAEEESHERPLGGPCSRRNKANASGAILPRCYKANAAAIAGDYRRNSAYRPSRENVSYQQFAYTGCIDDALLHCYCVVIQTTIRFM